MKISYIAFAAVTLMAAGLGWASAGELNVVIYPAPGIFMDAQSADGGRGLISPEFDKFVHADANRDLLVAALVKTAQSKLPNVVSKIEPIQKTRALILSLQITRAVRYEVPKPNGVVDAYYPITASIYLTNPKTGEVSYTTAYTYTSVQKEKVGTLNDHSGIYRDGVKNLIDELINKAAKEFKISETSVSIKAIQDDYLVLDAGQKLGVAVNNSLISPDGNNSVRVIFVQDHYSIAEVEKGMGNIKSLQPGGKLVRFAPQTNAADKPKVLVVGSSDYVGWGGNNVLVQFADGLSNAPFTNLYVNPLFASILSTIAAETGFTPKDLSQRALPDLFLRVRALNPVSFQSKTNLPYKSLHAFRGYALGELIDRSGRIVYANYAIDSIDDEVTGDMAFSDLDRKEVVLKNSLIELSTKFSKDVVVQHQKLAITSADGTSIHISDPNGVLSPGMPIITYRALTVKLESFMLPIWEASVVSAQDGVATANIGMAYGQGKSKPASGDWILLDTANETPASGQRITRCPNDVPAGLVIPQLADLGWTIYSRYSGALTYSPEAIQQINGLVTQSSDFEKDLTLKIPESNICVQPAYKIEIGEAVCSNGYCGKSYALKTGYRVKRGEEILKRAGLEGKLKTAGTYTGTAQADADLKDNSELLLYALPLLTKLASPTK